MLYLIFIIPVNLFFNFLVLTLLKNPVIKADMDVKFQLYQYFKNAALELAEQFDHRNKNDNFTKEIEDLIR